MRKDNERIACEMIRSVRREVTKMGLDGGLMGIGPEVWDALEDSAVILLDMGDSMEALRKELDVTDALLKTRDDLLNHPLLECQGHGRGCVPGAIEKLELLRKERDELKARWEKAEARVGELEGEDEKRATYTIQIAAIATENQRLREALEMCERNDSSKEYEHHEKRPFDDKTPREDGADGTCWLTPRCIAREALKEK